MLNILLQILDEGRITDAHGRTVSFENTVLVMTSNAGSNLKENALGFNKQQDEVAKDRVMKALGDFLRPEFLGRVDEIVVFRQLNELDFQKIAALLLDEFKEPMKEKGIEFGYDEAALALIAQKAYGHKSGARDIRRIIRKEVEDKIALLLVEKGEDNVSQIMKLTAKDGKFEILQA